MKTVKTILAAFALLSLLAGCQKSADNNLGKKVTVTVTAPNTDVLKVAFEQDANPDAGMALTWEDGDEITINGETFTIKDGFAGQTTAEFEGNNPGAGPYTISYNALPAAFAEQWQAADASTAHLKYGVTVSDATTYADVQFTDAWATAHGGTLEQSSVLRLRALLPSGVAATISSVTFKATEDIFGGSDELKVNITTPGDTDSDNILNVYASLPAGPEVTIPAGTEVLMQFQYGQYDNDLYTAHYQFADASAVIPGTVTAFKINRSGTGAYPDIRNYANASKADIGTSANPYLIGDKNQLYYMRTALDTDDVIKYFKLVDDVDWTRGVSASAGWHNLNNVKNGSNTWTRGVNLDGNNKTITGLNDSMFYVLMGEVKNLTLDGTSINVGNYVVGALAAYINQPNTVVNNVDVKNSSIVNNTGSNTSTNRAIGGLIGLINNVDAAQLAATISGCDVSNTNVTGGPATNSGAVGGVIGWANSKVSVSDCTFDGGSVTSRDKPYAGGFVGRSENFASSYTDCHVTNATIDMSALTTAQTHYGRGGGFSGMISTNNTVKGCTVGTSSQRVKLIFPAAEDVNNKKNLNCGGFTGINYGLISKDESDNHCTAYVDIVTPNEADTELHLGGFVGYNTGTIEYSDVDATFSTSATESVALTHGQHIGAFAGFNWGETATQPGKVEHCTAAGSVSGQDRVGGFIGYMKSGTVKDCSTSATVNANQYVGGFFGEVMEATEISGDSSTGVVTGATAYIGGFAGRFAGSVSCSNCKHETGKVSCPKGGSAATYVGGFVGYIGTLTEAFTGTITGCYVNNTIVESVKYNGSSAESSGTWNGGFAGVIGSQTYADNTGLVEKCGVYNSNKSAGQYFGGFAGVSYSKIEKCKVIGQFTMTGYGNNNGGLVGYQKGGHVKYCYSNATVRHNDKSNVGGLIGYANNTTVEECYSYGTITSTGGTTKSSTWGGVIGKADTPYTVSRLIRWNHSSTHNNNTIIGNVSGTPSGCYVKTSSDSNFYNTASSLGWSTDGSIWVYPDGGGVPTLKGV